MLYGHLLLQLFWQAFPGAVFVDLSKAAASQLAGQDGAEGLPAAVMVNDIGVETVIDAQKFDFEFNKVRSQRQSAADTHVCACIRLLAGPQLEGAHV